MKKRMESEKNRRKLADAEAMYGKSKRGQEMHADITCDSDDMKDPEAEDQGGRKFDNFEIAQKYYRLRKSHRDQLLHVAKVYLLSPLLFGRVQYPKKWEEFARQADILKQSVVGVSKEIEPKDTETIDDLEVSFDVIKRKVEMGDDDNLEILLSAMTRIGKRKEFKAVLLVTQQYDFVAKCASDLKSRRSTKGHRPQSYYKTVVVLSLKVVCYVIKMLIKQERDLVEEFKSSCEKDAEGSQPMKEEGNRSFQEGDYSNAVFQYTIALSTDSFNPLLYGNRALCYLKMGEYKAALADGKRCIVIKPDWDKGQHRYAQALFELGHYREAREANDTARKQCSSSKILDEQRTVFYEKMSGESRRSQPPDRSKPTSTTSKGTSSHGSATETDDNYRAEWTTTVLTTEELEKYKDAFPDPGMYYIHSGYKVTPPQPREPPSNKVSRKETEEFPDDLPELVSSDVGSCSDEDETDGLGDSATADSDKKKSDTAVRNGGESDDSMPELVESSGFEEDDEDNGRSSDSAIPGLVSDESGLSSDDMPLRIQRRKKQPKELDHDSEEAKREARRMEDEMKRRRIEENIRKARKKMDREEKKQEEAKRMKEVMRAEQKRRAQAEDLVLMPPSHLTSTKWDEEGMLLEDLGRKNSKWDSMREKLLRATRELLDGRSKQASLLFKDAIARVTTERPDYRDNFSNTDQAVLYYAVGVALLESGGHTDIQDAVMNFEKIIKTWEKLLFPLAYYGLGKSFAKQNRFTEALEPLNKGLEIVSLKSDWKPLSWPGAPTVVIAESEPDQLPLCFNELVILCTHPPKPDAIDKFPDHMGKREIYFTDPDFKGFVRVVCSDGCRLEYFPANWKKMKANYMDRSTEKDFLLQQCLTPDCPGVIELIQVFDHDSKPNTPKKTYHTDVKKDDFRQTKHSAAAKGSKLSRKYEKKLARHKKEQSEVKLSGADLIEDSSSVADDTESVGEPVSLVTTESETAKVEKSESGVVEQQIETQQQEPPQTENMYVLKKGDDEYLHGKQTDKQVKSKKKRVKNVQRLDDLIPQESYSHRSVSLEHELNTEDVESPFAMPLYLQEEVHAFEAGLEVSAVGISGQLVNQSEPSSLERVVSTKSTESNSTGEASYVSKDAIEGDPERELAMKENVWSFFVEILRQEGPLHITDRRMQQSYGLLPNEIQRYINYHGGLLNFLADSSEIDTAQQRLFLAEDADAVKQSLPAIESLPDNFQGYASKTPPMKLPRKPPAMESLPPRQSKPEEKNTTDLTLEGDADYAAAVAAASAASEDLASANYKSGDSIEDSVSFSSSFYPLSNASSAWPQLGRRSPSSSVSSASSVYGESETTRRRDERQEKERLKEGEMPPGKSDGFEAALSETFWREKERSTERDAYAESSTQCVESSEVGEKEKQGKIDEALIEHSRFLSDFDMSRRERSPTPKQDFKSPPPMKEQMHQEPTAPKKAEKEERKVVVRHVSAQTEIRTKNKEAQTSRELLFGKFDKIEKDKVRLEKELRSMGHQLEESKDRLVQQQKKYQMDLEREQKKTMEALESKKKAAQEEVDDLKAKLDAEVKRSAQEKKDRTEQIKVLKNKIRVMEEEEKKQSQARKEMELLIVQLRDETTEEKMKLELEAARFQHREKDLQATARHENKRAEKAEVQVLELQREKVITHLELSKRDADVAIMQLSQMLVANPHCAPLVREALGQWQSYSARLLPVIDEHKVAFDDRILSVQNGRDMNLLPPVNIAIPIRPTISLNAQLIAQQQALHLQHQQQQQHQQSMQLGQQLSMPLGQQQTMQLGERPTLPGPSPQQYAGLPAGVPTPGAILPSQMAPQPQPLPPDPSIPAPAAAAPVPSPPSPPQAEQPAAEAQTAAAQSQTAVESRQVQSKPQQPAQQPAQRPHKPVSYEKIMKRLWSKFPGATRPELVESIRQVRESNNNTLMGLQLEEVVAQATRIIAARIKEKTAKAAARGGSRRVASAPKLSSLSTSSGRKVSKGIETTEEEDDMCVICHEAMSASDVVVLECKHKFHLGCIRKWLTEQSTCPTCRVHSLLPDEYPSL